MGNAMRNGVLFVVDPLDGLKPAKDSSIAMMRELARRGHAIWACTTRDLAVADGVVHATAQALTLSPPAAAPDQAASWYHASPGIRQDLHAFDAVLMRKDPPFDSEYLYATHLLGAGVRGGARVFNAPEALRNHNEKLAILEFAQFI